MSHTCVLPSRRQHSFRKRRPRTVLTPLCGCLVVVLSSSACHADELDNLVRQSLDQLASSLPDEALTTANTAVRNLPEDPRARQLRAKIHESRREWKAALVDCDWLLDPDRVTKLESAADVYDLRGRVKFRLADATGSAVDFDKAVELDPRRGPGHWQRGISYYYAGKFDEGVRQFEGYQTVDDADVENAVWRYLCMARSAGSEAARRMILRVGDDRRVPMRQIYEMFAGRLEPSDVVSQSEQGEVSPAERRSRQFYAHLYVGLYHETVGDQKRAIEHIRRAAEEFAIGHYMADVARTHVIVREKQVQEPK